MTKEKWLSFREEVKQIKREIAALKTQQCYAVDGVGDFEGFKIGTLVKMMMPVKKDSFKKKELQECLDHFGQVAYLDLCNKVKGQVILRFKSWTQASSFLAKASSVDEESFL